MGLAIPIVLAYQFSPNIGRNGKTHVSSVPHGTSTRKLRLDSNPGYSVMKCRPNATDLFGGSVKKESLAVYDVVCHAERRFDRTAPK